MNAYIELNSGLDRDNSLHEFFQPLAHHDDIDDKIRGTNSKKRRFCLLRRETNLKSPLDIVLLGSEISPYQWG